MPLESDIKVNATKFAPETVLESTRAMNAKMLEIQDSGPRWDEVGAAIYRKMRWEGKTPFPAPEVLPSGEDVNIPSRESGRSIPCRRFRPESGKPKGVFYHIHGGGWVLMDARTQDLLLKMYADTFSLVVISVDYRLAPEHPYPAPNEDCFDVGEYLIDNSPNDYDCPLLFAGGQSAGAHLVACTTFHLLRTRPDFAFKALILDYGVFDLSGFLPQAHTLQNPAVLTFATMEAFVNAYLPGTTPYERKNAAMSPLYADVYSLKLPPALFTCGTADILLDDTVLMSTKWAMAGGESVFKAYPGAPHGMTSFQMMEPTKEAMRDTVLYVKEKMAEL